MLAGGMVIAAPSMVPEAAAANATLYVSAENSMFDNTFGGPQVIEIVVSDPSIQSLDDLHGTPDVTVNGKNAQLAQAADGSWYAYIVDVDMAEAANNVASGIVFGQLCANTDTAIINDANDDTLSFTQTQGFYSTACTATTDAPVSAALETVDHAAPTVLANLITLANVAPTSGVFHDGATITLTLVSDTPGEANVNNTSTTATFTDADGDGLIDAGELGTPEMTDPTDAGDLTLTELTTAQNVLNSQKLWNAVNSGNLHNDSFGGVGLDNNNDVFIQAFDFNPTGSVTIEYNKAGTNEVSTLKFDTTTDIVTSDLDRTKVPQGAHVHLDIGDPQLNIDPTSDDNWRFVSTTGAAHYRNGIETVPVADLMFEGNGVFKATANGVLAVNQTNADLTTDVTYDIGLYESGANTSVFSTTDDDDNSVIKVLAAAPRGTAGTIDYNDSPVSIVATNFFAEINMDESSIGDEWNSGEPITVTLVDSDLNLNTRSDEDLDVNTTTVSLNPSLQIGSPVVLASTATFDVTDASADVTTLYATAATSSYDTFGKVINFTPTDADANGGASTSYNLDVDTDVDVNDWNTLVALGGTEYLNYDVRSVVTGLSATAVSVTIFADANNDGLLAAGNAEDVLAQFALNASGQGLVAIAAETIDDALVTGILDTENLAYEFSFTVPAGNELAITSSYPIVADVFSFGDSINNAIYRMELEETGDNTSEFVGSIEYIMINQTNAVAATYAGLSTISNDIVVLVVDTMTDEDALRVNYLDLGADGVSTQIADQQDAPSHSGVVDLDLDNYKVADTVNVTLTDMDLNVDSDLIDVFITQASSQVDGDLLSTTTHVLDITFNDVAYDGLNGTGFTLTETDAASGIFVGSFQVPATYSTSAFASGTLDTLGDASGDQIALADNIVTTKGFSVGDAITVTGASGATATDTLIAADIDASGNLISTYGSTAADFTDDAGTFIVGEDVTITLTTVVNATTTGTDIEVNYNDHRDSSGNTIEVGDGAGIRANTGSISLDRTVYPVPWGLNTDFAAITSGKTPNSFSLFPVHATGITSVIDTAAEQINTAGGDLTIHVQVADADLDLSAVGEDKMNTNRAAGAVGPIKLTVSRGNSDLTLAYAGGTTASTTSTIVVGADPTFTARTMGPINEVAGDTGIFELDFTIRYTDGPESSLCPTTTTYTSLDGDAGVADTDRFGAAATAGTDYCILQGDILTVEYTDATDASGNVNTVTDSATFDLRNGVLQSDKSVYIIGSDMILTIIEPDWDLDNDGAQSYDLDVIEWDSSAQTTTIGSTSAFDPEPSAFRETGDSTGIFQVVIEIPSTLDSTNLERGEQIDLEYTDWGPSGANYVGAEDEDVNVTAYTSNFGATVELDQKVYTWTDKVYITIV
jgi:hypothetical protein